MSSVNQKLLSDAVRHAVALERYKTAEAKRIADYLSRSVWPDIIAKVPTAHRQGTMASIVAIVNKSDLKLPESMLKLAKAESRWAIKELVDNVPLDAVSFSSLNIETLRSIVNDTPVQGKHLNEWLTAYKKSTADKIQRQLRIGIVQGETTTEMARRLQDGIFPGSTREAQTLARTAANHVSTATRETTYAVNDDIVDKVQIVATLDTRTSEICMGQDGKVYAINEGPRPPFHFRCRTTTVPVTKSWKDLGAKRKEVPASTRASMDGQVPQRISYQRWLKSQPKARQIEALGQARTELFREGKIAVQDLTNEFGTPLTVKQLKAQAPLAVKLTPVEIKDQVVDLLFQLEDLSGQDAINVSAKLRNRGWVKSSTNSKFKALREEFSPAENGRVTWTRPNNVTVIERKAWTGSLSDFQPTTATTVVAEPAQGTYEYAIWKIENANSASSKTYWKKKAEALAVEGKVKRVKKELTKKYSPAKADALIAEAKDPLDLLPKREIVHNADLQYHTGKHNSVYDDKEFASNVFVHDALNFAFDDETIEKFIGFDNIEVQYGKLSKGTLATTKFKGDKIIMTLNKQLYDSAHLVESAMADAVRAGQVAYGHAKSPYQYIITHETGHIVSRSKQYAKAVDWIKTNMPQELSAYAKLNADEAFAEAYAKMRLTARQDWDPWLIKFANKVVEGFDGEDLPHWLTDTLKSSMADGVTDITRWRISTIFPKDHNGFFQASTVAPDGRKYFVKLVSTAEERDEIVLSGKIYEKLGIKATKAHRAQLQVNIGKNRGKFAVLYEIEPNTVGPVLNLTLSNADEIKRGLSVDMWLGNRKPVGEHLENFVNAGDFKYERLNYSGVFGRTSGGFQKHYSDDLLKWTNKPTLEDEFRALMLDAQGITDGSFNGGVLSNNLTYKELAESANLLENITDAELRELVKKYAPHASDDFVNVLSARRNTILKDRVKLLSMETPSAKIKVSKPTPVPVRREAPKRTDYDIALDNWVGDLTEEQITAITEFTDGDYKIIREYQVMGHGPFAKAYSQAKARAYKDLVGEIEFAIGNAPKYTGKTLIRNISLDANDPTLARFMKVGTVMKTETIQSFTMADEGLKGFGNFQIEVINADRYQIGADISSISGHTNEREFLMRSQVKFKVVSATYPTTPSELYKIQVEIIE